MTTKEMETALGMLFEMSSNIMKTIEAEAEKIFGQHDDDTKKPDSEAVQESAGKIGTLATAWHAELANVQQSVTSLGSQGKPGTAEPDGIDPMADQGIAKPPEAGKGSTQDSGSGGPERGFPGSQGMAPDQGASADNKASGTEVTTAVEVPAGDGPSTDSTATAGLSGATGSQPVDGSKSAS